jgi:electron transfer flavoprotein-quinone oxidoreductase
MGVGVKEVIELPAGTIEERFNLKPGEGSARMLLGCTEGIHGGGFLYTNEDSVSLGIVATVGDVDYSGVSVVQMLENFKEHPAIRPLIAD